MNPFSANGVDQTERNAELGLPVGVVLAPIWRRVLAQIIDQAVIMVPVAALFLAAGLSLGADTSTDEWLTFSIAFTCAAFVYEFVMIATLGRTVGKLALGTRVVRVDDASQVMWSSSAIRALVPLAAGVIPGVGMIASLVVYASASFDRRQQGFHDKACGSIVIMHRI